MKDMPQPQPGFGPSGEIGARVSARPPFAGIGPRSFRHDDVPDRLSAAQPSISFNMENEGRRDCVIMCVLRHETALAELLGSVR